MALILYVLTVIKFMFYVLIHNSIFAKIIFDIFLFFLQYKLKFSVKGPRNVSILSYKIKNFFIPIVFVSMYILVFIILLSVYRISTTEPLKSKHNQFINLNISIGKNIEWFTEANLTFHKNIILKISLFIQKWVL